MAKVDILIPAAGSSRRMGGIDKLLEPIDGMEQLRRVASVAAPVATEFGGHTHVAIPSTGPFAPARKKALLGLRLNVLLIPDAHEGMAASLRAGALAAHDADGLLVLPADMPDISADDLRKLISAFSENTHCALRATAARGAVGHPVIFPRRLLGELAVLAGDQGGRKVLVDEDVRYIALPELHATTDLDTPEEWAAWRSRNGR